MECTYKNCTATANYDGLFCSPSCRKYHIREEYGGERSWKARGVDEIIKLCFRKNENHWMDKVEIREMIRSEQFDANETIIYRNLEKLVKRGHIEKSKLGSNNIYRWNT